jgi:hypothetical protein
MPVVALLACVVAEAGLARVEPAAPPPTSIEPAAPARFPPEVVARDLDIVHRVLTELHPGLYRSLTPAEFEARFAALRGELAGGATRSSAFLAITRTLAALRCGHTYCNFFNQPAEVKREVLERGPRLPFHFRWLGDRMVVTRNLSGNPLLQPGTVIQDINGRPVHDVLWLLMTFARADGGNDAKRRASLDVRGEDEFEAFDVLFALAYEGQSHELEFETVSLAGETRVVRARALTHEDRARDARAHREPGDNPHGWTLTRPPAAGDAVAVLTMPTWAVFNSDWDWRAWLNGQLDALASAGTTDLVVDLRGNEGGLDCGDPILSRLVGERTNLSSTRRYVRYRTVPADLNPFLDTWDDSFRDWGTEPRPAATPELVAQAPHPYFLLDPEGGGPRVVEPVQPRFAGRVWVLVDSSCSSASFQFADAVQRNGLGTLVGEPTGGNRRGINGGAFFFLRLPGTGIEVDIPLIARFPEGSPADEGLTPDVPVDLTPAGIAAGRDPALAAVLSRVQQSRP